MQLDLRDLYDLETIIAESLLIESPDPKVAAWVTGTAGGFSWSRSGKQTTGTLTLEVQLLVPQSIHDRLEEKLNEWLDLDLDEPAIRGERSKNDDSPDTIRPYTNADDFIRASLDPNDRGQLIREWCRNYSVHNNPLGMGLCPSMTETQYIQWVNEWHDRGYSTNEGTWLGGGQRHRFHDEECPWCCARMKKGIATGSPHVPAPPLAPDTRRKLLKSRYGSLGRACGDPVRPLSFRTQDIGFEGGSVEVRGKKESKLWYSSRFKDMAQILMKKYRQVIVDAVDTRLGIPDDSPLHRLVFGVKQKKKSIPSNMKIYLADGRSSASTNGTKQYMSQGYGKVQDMQAMLYNSYSPDAPGPRFTQYLTDKRSGKEEQERVSFVDLNQLETHFAYHYLVDLYLDQSVALEPAPREQEQANPWGDFDLSGFGAVSGEPQHESFMSRLATEITKNYPERAEEHGYWVDNTGQVFTIMKIATGLKGLQFLIDPFLPMKSYELEQWKEIDPATYKQLKLIPSFSPAWEMGGRDNQVALETLAEYLQDNFEITLAPYHQFRPYPIGQDGTIYYIKEDDMIVVDGKTVVGQIIDKDDDGDLLVEQLTVQKTSKGEGEDVVFQDIMKPRSRRDYQIVREIITIPADQIDSLGKVTLENKTYLNLANSVTMSSKVEDTLSKELDDLKIVTPDEEHIQHLIDRYGDKFVDKLGVIDPNKLGEVYEWTDPKLWSKELVTQLATPREYVDQDGKFFVRKNTDEGVIWDLAGKGKTYAFSIIEDRSHPMTPYVRQSDDNYIHALDDPEFQYELKLRGMEWNPLTRQWEATAEFPFYDSDGVKKIKRVKFNEALFWMNQTGKRHDQMLESFARPSAVTGENIKTMMDRKDPHEVQLGIERWTKEWYAFNNRRIKNSDRLFPSPYNMLNPPEEYWDQVAEMGLPIPPNSEHGEGFKKYWPCRGGLGQGRGGCDGCDHCEQEYVPEYYANQAGLDPDNPVMVRFSDGSFKTRDLWTGLEWLAYLVALQRWNNELDPKDSHKMSKERFRAIKSNFYKGYDLYCLQHKVKREKGKPIDLSGLSEVDKLMLIANWQGGLPKTFDIKLTDDYITGMRAVYTDLFYRVMPDEYRAIMENTVKPDQLRFRPDLLIDDVSFLEEYADQTAHMATLSADELRKKGEELAKRRARRKAKVETSSPEDLKEEAGDPEDTFVPNQKAVKKQFDPDEHTVEARIQDEEDPDEEDPTEIEDQPDTRRSDWYPDEEDDDEESEGYTIDPDTGEVVDDEPRQARDRWSDDDDDDEEEYDYGDKDDDAAAWLAQIEREKREKAQEAEIEDLKQREADEPVRTSRDDPEDAASNLQDIDMPGGSFDYDDDDEFDPFGGMGI